MPRFSHGLGLALACGLVLAAGCGQVTPPTVEAAPLGDTRDAIGPYLVSAVVSGPNVTQVRAYHRAEGAPQAGMVDLKEVEPGRWQGDLPGYPAGTTVHWFVEAEDQDGNVGYAPPEAELGDSVCVDTLKPGSKTPPGGASYCFSVLR